MTEIGDLVDGAFEMGRAAAREVLDRGDAERPTLIALPYAQTRYLLGRDGTSQELRVVADAWTRGVAEVWDSRTGGSNGGPAINA